MTSSGDEEGDTDGYKPDQSADVGDRDEDAGQLPTGAFEGSDKLQPAEQKQRRERISPTTPNNGCRTPD
jgi:hypothetical protein